MSKTISVRFLTIITIFGKRRFLGKNHYSADLFIYLNKEIGQKMAPCIFVGNNAAYQCILLVISQSVVVVD